MSSKMTEEEKTRESVPRLPENEAEDSNSEEVNLEMIEAAESGDHAEEVSRALGEKAEDIDADITTFLNNLRLDNLAKLFNQEMIEAAESGDNAMRECPGPWVRGQRLPTRTVMGTLPYT